MKACKKYWNEEVKPYIHNPADKEIFDAGWRAALEWLLTQHPCGYMRDVVEKELEDK